jgi:tol-pal system protein YbgF
MRLWLKNRFIELLRPALTLWLPASALFLLLLAPGAHAITQTRKDITELQRTVFTLQSDISDLKGEIENLPSEESIALVRQVQADILAQLSELLRDVQVMTGRFEESKYYMDKFVKDTSAEVDLMKARVDTATPGLNKEEARKLIERIESIEAELAAIKEKLPALEAAIPAGPEETPPKEATPEEVYEAALNTFREEKHKEAREMMEAFIRKYPEHTLAGNAQFWIAETYYAEKDYDDAILAYEDLLQKHKKHSKVPAAILKQGLAFIELGDNKAARGILREVIEKYPKSEQAKTASEKLSTLEGSESSNTTGPPEKK